MQLVLSRTVPFLLVIALLTSLIFTSTGEANSATADRIAPTTPVNLVVQARTNTSITFSWSASRDNVRVNGYHIYRNGKRIVALHRTTSFTDRNLLPGQRYQYTVRALDAAGNASRLSNILNAQTIQQEPLDSRYGVYYQIFVRAFADSNGDGTGDFNGITQRLDYLNDGNPRTTTDLGIDGIWLMPIFPSPSYHGYDITDYYGVNSAYGTMDDFKRLVREAKKRGIKIILDMVLNHTSAQHPWFQQATSSTNNKYRNWFVWANRDTNLNDRSPVGARAWYRSGNSHYLSVFFGGMPDLNFDNPEVRAEAAKIGKFWLQLGVDGFRMDAAKHVYEDTVSSKSDPATNEKNQAMWKEFRNAINTVNPNAYMVGEIWDSKEVIAPYLDKSYNSAFNFDLAKKIIAAADSQVAVNLGRTIEQMYAIYDEVAAGQYQDAPFLSNHDQDRVMSVLGENIDKMKMAASMLLTLPGIPFLYYGEEVGMLGEKPDEKIRLPFPWSSNRYAPGMSFWKSDPYYSDQNSINSFEVQNKDPNSLLSHYRKMIRLRKQEVALHQGNIKPYPIFSTSIESYMRFSRTEKVLVVHNLGGSTETITMPTARNLTTFNRLVFSSNTGARLANGRLTIPAYTTVLLK